MPAEICQTCNLPHPPLTPCADAQAEAMKQLLLMCGTVDTCDCGKTIYWMRHSSGRKAPYTVAGLIHFRDCAGKFKDRAK